jgi:hypothetical protein
MVHPATLSLTWLQAGQKVKRETIPADMALKNRRRVMDPIHSFGPGDMREKTKLIIRGNGRLRCFN